jgi:dehydrogenase/reductase SDR family protein 7B
MKFKDKVVWITGASSGIGEGLVHAFAREGARLVLHSLTFEELDNIAGYCTEHKVDHLLLAFDLSAHNDYPELVRKVTGRFGRIDVLVNNAGISQRALAQETLTEVDRKIFEINFFSAIELTKAVLPVMLAQGYGSIAASSSITGLFGFPLRSAYAASKHAVSGFFETLGIEMRSGNIFVTVAYPGRVRTEISKHSLRKDGSTWDRMDEGLDRGISVKRCARRYLRAIYRKKRTVYIGGFELIMPYLKRYCPPLFYLAAGKVKPT